MFITSSEEDSRLRRNVQTYEDNFRNICVYNWRKMHILMTACIASQNCRTMRSFTHVEEQLFFPHLPAFLLFFQKPRSSRSSLRERFRRPDPAPPSRFAPRAPLFVQRPRPTWLLPLLPSPRIFFFFLLPAPPPFITVFAALFNALFYSPYFAPLAPAPHV